MKVLIFGDIYGRIGRNAFLKEYKDLITKYSPDFIVANIENISSGRGPIEKHIKELDNKCDIDVYTSGNHIFDNYFDIKDYLDRDNSKMIRPANYYENEFNYFPGKGYKIVEKNGKKLLVINIMSKTFMKDDVYNPFLKINQMLKDIDLSDINGIIVDFHRETTAEIYALGFFLDGKVSFIYGTHTHIQTNDELILPKQTGILTDVGMSGPLYSVIGVDYESIKHRFLGGVLGGKMEQSLDKNYVVSGCFVEIDDKTKECINIEKIRLRGTL